MEVIISNRYPNGLSKEEKKKHKRVYERVYKSIHRDKTREYDTKYHKSYRYKKGKEKFEKLISQLQEKNK